MQEDFRCEAGVLTLAGLGVNVKLTLMHSYAPLLYMDMVVVRKSCLFQQPIKLCRDVPAERLYDLSQGSGYKLLPRCTNAIACGKIRCSWS